MAGVGGGGGGAATAAQQCANSNSKCRLCATPHLARSVNTTHRDLIIMHTLSLFFYILCLKNIISCILNLSKACICNVGAGTVQEAVLSLDQ